MQKNAFSKSAMEFAAQINCGWNLGNSLDVAKGWGGETGWGNPVITKELIQAVADKGFNTIRIPVTWDTAFGPAPDCQLDQDWVSRVREVVDWAIDCGLFVIVNTHHEGRWLKASGKLTEQQIREMLDTLHAVWTQIAKAFASYPEQLILEGCNEVRDGDDWSGYPAAFEVINRINETFVKAVRAAGGNNAKRYLLLNGYAAIGTNDVLNAIRLPDDPEKHLMVSAHLYKPADFSFPPFVSHGKDETVYQTADLEETATEAFDMLQTLFVQKNVPVIIGEMGSVNKNNTADRVRHVQDYIRMTGMRGIKCIWWDNNVFGGEGEAFGLLNRETLEWTFGEVADAMVEQANRYC